MNVDVSEGYGGMVFLALGLLGFGHGGLEVGRGNGGEWILLSSEVEEKPLRRRKRSSFWC